MKKILKFFSKTVKILVCLLSVLFGVYITNADSKLVEVVYDFLQKYHEDKVKKDTI